MARPRDNNPRVLGPYADRRGFRIIHVKRGGGRDAFCFATKEEARRAIQALKSETERPTITISEALKLYEDHMRDDKGNKELSVEQTRYKLRRFFPDFFVRVADLDRAACAAYYDVLRTSKQKAKGKEGRPISVDYHRNVLAEARTFLKWCVKKSWLTANPLDGVEGVGRRRHGKEQLRVDEARKWLARATELANAREAGAVAAMMTLLMGMRCSEIVTRVVRDLDDEGRLLWIPDSKTDKGKRRLAVPESLRPYLQQLADGKKATDLLFGHHDRDWPRAWVRRICEAAEVPIVTAHGQRGLHATLAVEAGVTARAVADSLGHESFKTTAQSYAKAEGVEKAQQDRALKVLDGGKSQRKEAA